MERMEERKPQQPASRFWMVLSVLLAAVVVALTIGLIYMASNTPEPEIVTVVKTRTQVLTVYDGFFRTQDQQKVYVEEFLNNYSKPEVPETTQTDNIFQYIQVCNFTKPQRKRRDAHPLGSYRDFRRDENLRPQLPQDHGLKSFDSALLRDPFSVRFREDGSRLPRDVSSQFDRYIESSRYHGCCTSRRKFISPASAVSEDQAHTYTLVQYEMAHRQYFLSQDCWHVAQCPLNCGCRQQAGLYRAVVLNPDYDSGSTDQAPVIVRTIRVPGSCKCFNGLSDPNS